MRANEDVLAANGGARLLASVTSERGLRIARRLSMTVWAVTFVGLPLILVGWQDNGMLDLEVYRNGGLAWLNGISLYDGFPGTLPGPRLPFTYPPLSAVLFSLFAWTPYWLTRGLVTMVSFLALSAATVVVAGRLDHRLKWTLGPVAAVAAFGLEPVNSTFSFGQVNLALMALVAVDCLAVRRFRGVLVGLAAAIKLTPAVFVLYFLVKRDWKAAATSIASFVGFGLVGFLFDPVDSREYWFSTVFDPSRIGGLAYMNNQSIRGVLHRLHPLPVVETLLWAVLTIMVLALAWRAARRAANDVVALTAIAVAGLLASPVSWSHHWVWAAPAFLALGWQLWRARAWRWTPVLLGALAVFCVAPFKWMPSSDDRELNWTLWQHIPGDAYVWLAIGMLTVLAFRASRSRPISTLDSGLRITTSTNSSEPPTAKA
ncbi:glycosyltransferase 87 family protein [Kutzneria sp. CA-103260]|uniref:glycosyltransferase 87 family protein n=1 Tax=Kutzneria sp. CA-103260 TaxID=2802641 RepID=UPI001BA7AC5A|nr:glycosyltransferase 87 family protein [Kutzneria sp. CA-103260]QUQ66268.1 integral membrane protein [Kutzneria sp. CA-103260]